MGRPVILSNGGMLVGLNELGLVHDFYYPYVGLENLTTSRSVQHKIGVWVDGNFSWLDDDWQIDTDFETDALISSITAQNLKLEIKLEFKDFVDYRYTAFCRKIAVHNLADHQREIRVFMHQVFQISRAGRGDTALYVPEGNYILDYKGRCSLLIYSQTDTGMAFDQFAVGNYAIEGKEGTYKDAEDGELSGSLVEHGGVDTVLRHSLQLSGGGYECINYWIIASDSQFHAEVIHHSLKEKGLDLRLERTRNYWGRWLSVSKTKLQNLPDKYQSIAKKSLMVVKSHIDNRGGIIASCDSSIYNYGRDYYSYVWPRDGALTILPLIDAGYQEEPRRFLEFCADTMHPAGYMMHKYQPDKAIGSTWHPLVHGNRPELAIQEDETAAVVYAAAYYYQKFNDQDFITREFDHLIKPAVNFMTRFIDKQTNLPHASYDLWEEKFATHTYTVFLSIAAIEKAAEVAESIGRVSEAGLWKHRSQELKSGLKLLYNEDKQYYRKSLMLTASGDLEFDDTLDSSSGYGYLDFYKDVMPDEVLATFRAIEAKLLNSTPVGGVPRYERDNYFKVDEKYPGNPWLICTLWMAQYYLRQNNSSKADELIDWVIARSTSSGMLPEQVHPETGQHIGVSPLVWSHAELVKTLLQRYN